MPDRMIRDRCRRSPTLQRLSDAAERAWWRLTTYADDYGRFEADPEVLLAGLMLRRPNGWNVKRMQKVIEEWADQTDPLIHQYMVPGDLRVYGHCLTFSEHQRDRNSIPKYPDPPCADLPDNFLKCGESLQVAANCGLSSNRNRSSNRSSNRNRIGGRGILPQTSEWGTPESLVLKYNRESPPECTSVTVFSPGRIKKAREYLSVFPDESYWTNVFKQLHRYSRKAPFPSLSPVY